MSVTVSNRQRLLRVDSWLLKRVLNRALQYLDTIQDRLVSIGANLNVVLVNDAAIATLNRKFHGTDGPTDVLSFGYSQSPITGELVVSVEHALTQAKQFHSEPSRELVLYVLHGILHLFGYDDRSKPQRRAMRAMERRLLNRLATEYDLNAVVKSRPRTQRRRGNRAVH